MIYSNNRFLKRVNPEITRALNETGAAALMRQMVDLDIAKNLVGWWHRDNVNTRFASPDTFVTSALDSSGGDNNATQTTEANQPKLVSLGMEFDGSDDYFDMGASSKSLFTGFSNLSISLWIKTGQQTRSAIYTSYSGSGAYPFIGFDINRGENIPDLGYFLFMFRNYSNSTQYDFYIRNTNTINFYDNAWHNIVFSGDVSTPSGDIYFDGSLINTTYQSNESVALQDMIVNIYLGASNNNNNPVAHTTGTLNDIRIFNSALSATEITAIFNQTKGAYGL